MLPEISAPVFYGTIGTFALISFLLGLYRVPKSTDVLYGKKGKRWPSKIFGALIVVAGVASVLLAIQDVSQCGAMIALWAVLPPIWLFFEYFYLLDQRALMDSANKQAFDLYRHGQDLTAKCWIGFVGLLYVIYRTHGGN